jgi:hypothetical protein
MCAGSRDFADEVLITSVHFFVDRPSKEYKINATIKKEARPIGALLKNRPSLIVRLTLTLVLTIPSALAFGQSAEPPSEPNVAPGVPRLVKFRGQLADASGNLLTNTVGVMFAIYSEQTGGVPLWQETQNVQFSQGRYTVFLGNNTSGGIPSELFASGQSQWLGVKALLPGEEEQPRVLLASVPYALKAVDADTLGGVPASSYLRANPVSSGSIATPLASSVSAPGVASRTAAPVLGVSTGQAPTSPATRIRRSTASGEESGTISINDSTSASSAFTTKWASPPVCTLTPTSDPHAIGGYWVTSSTSTVTANVHYAGRITFNFRCQAATNF